MRGRGFLDQDCIWCKDVAHVSSTLMHSENVSKDDTAVACALRRFSKRQNPWSMRIFVSSERFAARRECADVLAKTWFRHVEFHVLKQIRVRKIGGHVTQDRSKIPRWNTFCRSLFRVVLLSRTINLIKHLKQILNKDNWCSLESEQMLSLLN